MKVRPLKAREALAYASEQIGAESRCPMMKPVRACLGFGMAHLVTETIISCGACAHSFCSSAVYGQTGLADFSTLQKLAT